MIVILQNAREFEDFANLVPAALASLRTEGSRASAWECRLVTSDWALARSMLLLASLPAWCSVVPSPVLSSPAHVKLLSPEALQVGAFLVMRMVTMTMRMAMMIQADIFLCVGSTEH